MCEDAGAEVQRLQAGAGAPVGSSAASHSVALLSAVHSFSVQHSAFSIPLGSGLQSNLDPASGAAGTAGAAGQRSAAALPTASSRQESGRRAPESQVKAMNGSGQLANLKKKRKKKAERKKKRVHLSRGPLGARSKEVQVYLVKRSMQAVPL